MTPRKLALAGACAALTFSVTPAARAASFDCARAKTRTEHVICNTRALNDQDVRMAVMLDVLAQFELMGGRAQQRDDQRAWLKLRGACDAEAACLTRVYQRRVDALHAQIEGLAGAPHDP